jgi:rubrerythrin
MPKNKAAQMAGYVGCLSLLEYNTALLYEKLSEKTKIPLAKSLLLSISQDSLKHSLLLRGVNESLSASKVKDKECSKMLGQIWQNVNSYLNEVTAKEELSMQDFYDKLVSLESIMAEEYYVLVQMQTLAHLTKEINELYSIDLEQVKGIFESIIRDEEHHRELLATVKDLSGPEKEVDDLTPIIKYLHPDGWINSA